MKKMFALFFAASLVVTMIGVETHAQSFLSNLEHSMQQAQQNAATTNQQFQQGVQNAQQQFRGAQQQVQQGMQNVQQNAQNLQQNFQQRYAEAQRKLKDHAFNSYVDPETMHAAVHSADPKLMSDVAMQLGEGERVLNRQHNAVSADDMARVAARIAGEKGDAETLQRLQTYAKNSGRDQLNPHIADALKKVQHKQAIVDTRPKFADSGNPRVDNVVNGILNEIDKAVHMHNHDAINQIQGSLQNWNLPPEVQQQINQHIDQERQRIPQESDSATQSLQGLLDSVFHHHKHHDDQPQPVPPSEPGGWNNTPQPGGWGNNAPNAPPIGGGIGSAIAIDSAPGQGAYFGRMLRAQFVPDRMGAKITAIYPGSPLYGRLRVGDVISYMDGMAVDSSWQLENHYGATALDYYDFRSGRPRRTTININNY